MATINASFGSSQRGSLSNGSNNIYLLTAAAGGLVKIDFTHPNGAGTDGAPIKISLFDALSNVVASQTVTGNSSFVTTVAVAGEYALKVADGDPYDMRDGGAYVITPMLNSEKGTTYDGASNNTAASALTTALGAPIVGSLNPYDVDMFKFHANQGGLLTLDLHHPQGAGSNGLPIEVTLFDTDSNVLTSQTLNGDSQLVCAVANAGDYYLKLADVQYYSSGHGGTYTATPTLNTNAGATYDGAANNNTNSALASPLGAPIIGTLGAYDVDVFKVHANSGGALTLSLQHPHGAGSSGAALDLTVLDAAGNTVASERFTGNGKLLTTVPAAGDYFVKIKDVFGNQTDENSPYTLLPTLLNLPAAVYDGATNNTSATALGAPLGTTIIGTLSSSDTDFFKFNAPGSGDLIINFAHPEGFGHDGSAIKLTLFDSGGNTLYSTIEKGSELLTASLPGAGVYYLRIGNDYNFKTLPGTYQLMAGMSSAGGSQIVGTDVADHLSSTSGNDLIIGGAGLDVVAYHGNSGDYQINVSAVGAHLIDNGGRDGADTLIDVERLSFNDRVVALDVDGVAGQAYRLYQAAFNRAPDAAGLGYWITQMDHGATLPTVALAFTQSQEYLQRYGGQPENHALVAAFYANILHRAPDPGGLDYWNAILDNHQADAAAVLASFSASAENVAQLTGVLAQGISYIPFI